MGNNVSINNFFVNHVRTWRRLFNGEIEINKILIGSLLASYAYLESFLYWDEECMEALGLEKWFLFVYNHSLIEASNAMRPDIK